MKTTIFRSIKLTLSLAMAITLCTFATFFNVTSAQEATSSPAYLEISKQISGDAQGYSPSDFSFHVTGGGVNETVPHGGTVSLLPGSYLIEEIVPNGFVKEDWRVGWYGDLCEIEEDQYFAAFTVSSTDFERYTSDNPARCLADNQYRPENNGGGGNSGSSSTLRVVKVVSGTSTSPASFSFAVNGGTAVAFEADGNNDLTVASGTYSVVESSISSNYTVSYNNCTNLVLAGDDEATCTITNTWTGGNGGGGGGNGTSTKEYRIEGFVWQDDDKNGERLDGESFLTGWSVTAVNGSTILSTTTDNNGYYYFDVEAGTWTISETLQDGWAQTFPVIDPRTHVVTVPQGEEEMTLAFPFNLFFKVAQAAVVNTYSGYNFGNVFDGSNGGGGGSNGDGDDDNGGGSGGCYRCSDGGGGNGGGGTPRVLGDQISAVPLGAAAGGAGGASSNLPSYLAFMWPVLAWFGF